MQYIPSAEINFKFSESETQFWSRSRSKTMEEEGNIPGKTTDRWTGRLVNWSRERWWPPARRSRGHERDKWSREAVHWGRRSGNVRQGAGGDEEPSGRFAAERAAAPALDWRLLVEARSFPRELKIPQNLFKSGRDLAYRAPSGSNSSSPHLQPAAVPPICIVRSELTCSVMNTPQIHNSAGYLTPRCIHSY